MLALGVFIREQMPLLLSVIVFSIASALLFLILHWNNRSNREKKLLWCLSSVIVLSGMMLHSFKLSSASIMEANCLATEDWQPVRLKGHVVSIPKFRPDKSLFTGNPTQPDDAWLTAIDVQYYKLINPDGADDQTMETHGIVRVIIPGRHRNFAPGDHLECFLKWRRIPPPSNPGEYDLARRLRQQGIFTQGSVKSAAQLQQAGLPRYWSMNRYLGKLAMAGDRAIEQYVPFDQAPLASALVLGQRDQIEWKLSESLLETGTVHMLAISGMHVEMVAVSIGVLCLLLRVPQRMTLVIICITVIGYTFLCGANAPVLRAMFAVLMVSVARFWGFTTNPYNLLSLAALCVIALRTDHLWDTGTQLSFLAVAVLIYVASEGRLRRVAVDPLDELLESTETWKQRMGRKVLRFCKESLYVSAWVWLVTTPIVFSTFHIVSPVAILMNLLLLVPLWIGLISGLCLMLLGPIFPWIGTVLGFICGSNLAASELAIYWAAKIPLSHWWSHAPPMWWVIGFYSLAIVLFLFSNHSLQSRNNIFRILLCYFALGCLPWYNLLPQSFVERWIYFQPSKNGSFAMTFIDVGHGTSVLMQLPNGENWLYDAGRMGDPDRAFYPIANTLWYLRVRQIDRLFLSHADSDHFNAIPALSKRFAVKQLDTTNQVIKSQDRNLRSVLAVFQRHSIPINILESGDQWHSGKLTCRILHPDANAAFANDNAASLSILIEYAGRKLLLPGDLEGIGVDRLMQSPPTKVDLMMAPHHGSLADDPDAFLGWAKPSHVVISGGTRANRLSVLKAYSHSGAADVWVTARDHALRVEVSEDGAMAIQHWRDDRWSDLEQVKIPNEHAEDDDDLQPSAF